MTKVTIRTDLRNAGVLSSWGTVKVDGRDNAASRSSAPLSSDKRGSSGFSEALTNQAFFQPNARNESLPDARVLDWESVTPQSLCETLFASASFSLPVSHAGDSTTTALNRNWNAERAAEKKSTKRHSNGVAKRRPMDCVTRMPVTILSCVRIPKLTCWRWRWRYVCFKTDRCCL